MKSVGLAIAFACGSDAWVAPAARHTTRVTPLMGDASSFGKGPSLEWGGTDTTTSGARKLTEALAEGDIDRKKAIEEARFLGAHLLFVLERPHTRASTRIVLKKRAVKGWILFFLLSFDAQKNPTARRPSAAPSGRSLRARRRCARFSS